MSLEARVYHSYLHLEMVESNSMWMIIAVYFAIS